MTIQKGIITALATGALFVSTLTPMALADTLVSGNGAVSDNAVSLNNNSRTAVDQNNNADIRNDVTNNSNTGGNQANFNTGGSTAINTGDAANNTWVSTQANANVANLSGCNTCNNAGVGDIAIRGNGAFSDNAVRANNNNASTSVFQNNDANVTNTVRNNANTGNNSASFNTGGDTAISTGNAGSNTSIATNVNANVARVGGGDGNGFGNGGSALIAGNGAESENAIALRNGSTTRLNQNNDAFITNDVSNRANTGRNNADFNTGGGTFIGTGDAINNTNIQNRANFNSAALNGCGCATDGNGNNVAIVGNGAFSQNTVRDNFGKVLTADQFNNADIANRVRNNQITGRNSSGFNTSDGWNWDGNNNPSFLFTGGAENNTGLSNKANVNRVNNGAGLNWDGTNIGLSFDMNDLLNQLHW